MWNSGFDDQTTVSGFHEVVRPRSDGHRIVVAVGHAELVVTNGNDSEGDSHRIGTTKRFVVFVADSYIRP